MNHQGADVLMTKISILTTPWVYYCQREQFSDIPILSLMHDEKSSSWQFAPNDTECLIRLVVPPPPRIVPT